MAISFSRYVDITSGVGGGAAVRQRDLILRLFTTNTLVPTGTVIEMTSADDVATYFGTASDEYLRAVFYFGFVSKNITAPNKISFARWADVAAAPKIYGTSGTYTASQFSAIDDGSFHLVLGSHAADLTGLDFTSVTTLSQVAGVIQTAIRAVSAGGTQWTSATVTYDTTAQRFELVGGATGDAPVSVSAAATGTPIAALLGWTTTAIFSPGADAEEPLDAFIASVGLSNNFGSFAFIDALTVDQVTAVATQNDTYNVAFIYTVGIAVADASAYYSALSTLSGVAVTIAPLSTEYPELLPAAILAATDYSRRNSVQNYMFQQASLTPSVTTNALADTLDAVRANWYGQTQTAGQYISFYQRGVMMGLATDPVDLNTYANEIWLKDAAGAAIMTQLLSAARVPANDAGRIQLMATLQAVIEQATFNGVISVGKTLSTAQKLAIGNLTGDDQAWQQVYRIGYWLNVVIQSYVTESSATEYKAVYTLIYSKDDAIRKVEGSHVLI